MSIFQHLTFLDLETANVYAQPEVLFTVFIPLPSTLPVKLLGYWKAKIHSSLSGEEALVHIGNGYWWIVSEMLYTHKTMFEGSELALEILDTANDVSDLQRS